MSLKKHINYNSVTSGTIAHKFIQDDYDVGLEELIGISKGKKMDEKGEVVDKLSRNAKKAKRVLDKLKATENCFGITKNGKQCSKVAKGSLFCRYHE